MDRGHDSYQHHRTVATAGLIDNLVQLLGMIDDEVVDLVHFVRGQYRRARFDGMHEITVGLRQVFAHQRDLAQRGGIKMPDSGVVEGFQDGQVRITLDCIHDAARKGIEKIARLAFDFLGSQTVHRVTRLQILDNILDGRERAYLADAAHAVIPSKKAYLRTVNTT